MNKVLNAYRANTTYEAFNVFWETPGVEWTQEDSEPIGMLWGRHEVLDYCQTYGIEPHWYPGQLVNA